MHISCSKNSSPTIIPTKPTMENKQCIKLLRVHFSSNLRWDIHTNHVRKQCHSRFYALRVLKPILSHDDLLNVYSLFIRSLLEYCAPLFVAINEKNNRVLNSVQHRCHNLICGFGHTCHCLEDLRARRERSAMTLFKKSASNPDNTLHRLIPHKIRTYFSQPHCHSSQRFNSFIPFTTAIVNKSLSRV